MAEYFNKKSGISSRIPLRSFNAMFNFTGSWNVDAATTKFLALVGYCITLYKVNLGVEILALHDEIKRVVPYTWVLQPWQEASLRMMHKRKDDANGEGDAEEERSPVTEGPRARQMEIVRNNIEQSLMSN